MGRGKLVRIKEKNKYKVCIKQPACKTGQGTVVPGNNPITFNGKPIRAEEFLNKMVETLVIIKNRRSKGKPRKMES